MPSMPEPITIKTEFEGFKFDATGPADIIGPHFTEALKAYTLLKSLPPNPAHSSRQNGDQRTDGHQRDSGALESDDADRMFEMEGDTVVLRALPQGKTRAGDALLVILYGYKKLGGIDQILGMQIMKSARRSGIPVDRVDRSLDVHKALFSISGSRKSRAYMLNKQGENTALKIIESTLNGGAE